MTFVQTTHTTIQCDGTPPNDEGVSEDCTAAADLGSKPEYAELLPHGWVEKWGYHFCAACVKRLSDS